MQGLRGVAQHTKQAKHQRALLAMVEEKLRGGGGPMTAAFLEDLEHDVDSDRIVVPAWSRTVSEARYRFSQLLR